MTDPDPMGELDATAAQARRDALRRELGPDERLLWDGAPRQGLRLKAADALMIPFSLMWGGFAVFWEVMVIKMRAPFFFKLWGVPFVLVGFYIVVGRFFADAAARKRTTYAVTDQRVIILSGWRGGTVKSIDLKQLPDLTLSERPDGTGTISFGAASMVSGWGPAFTWQGRGSSALPSFDSIDQARRVYERIRAAQLARG